MTVCNAKSRLFDDRIGGAPLYYLAQSNGIFMRVPETVRKCIAFVGVRQGDGTIRYGGTAFAVNIAQGGIVFFYLVTAKHVADATQGDCLLRMNSRDGRAELIDAGEVRWWNHPLEADTVDVSVTPWVPPPHLKLDARTISGSNFATPEIIEKYKIGIGDEVCISGLFTRVTETAKIQPVVRMGNIAMMPDEKIEFPKLGLIDAYVLETRSLGGLSGCPVFVRNTASVPLVDGPDAGKKALYGVGSFWLLGSMIGHWQVSKNFDPVLTEAVNMGLSVIVPTFKLIEVLNHPELAAMRKDVIDEHKKKELEGAVLDSDFGTEMQKTAKGLEIPVPTTDQFFADLKKASRKKD